MKSNKAFTLVELMIVISIVGMLAAIAIPKFSDMVRKAEEAVTKNNIGVLRSVTAIYYADHTGTWPYENTGGANYDLLSDLDSGAALTPKYVNEIPIIKTGREDYPNDKTNEVAVALDGGGTFVYDSRDCTGDSAWVYYKNLGTWYANCDLDDTKGDAIHSW